MAGFLALKREKRELEVRLESLHGRIHVAREELARLKEEQSGIVESLKTSSDEMRRLEVEAVALHHLIVRLESEIQKLDQTESVASAELSQLLAEKQDLELKMKDAAADIEKIEAGSRGGEQDLLVEWPCPSEPENLTLVFWPECGEGEFTYYSGVINFIR